MLPHSFITIISLDAVIVAWINKRNNTNIMTCVIQIMLPNPFMKNIVSLTKDSPALPVKSFLKKVNDAPLR